MCLYLDVIGYFGLVRISNEQEHKQYENTIARHKAIDIRFEKILQEKAEPSVYPLPCIQMERREEKKNGFAVSKCLVSAAIITFHSFNSVKLHFAFLLFRFFFSFIFCLLRFKKIFSFLFLFIFDDSLF